MTNANTPRAKAAISGGERLPVDTLVNLAWIARDSGMSEKWFYKLIARGGFMPPIKFGRSSRWRAGDYYDWLDQQRQQAVDVQAQRRQRHLAQTRQKKSPHRAGDAS